MADTINFFDGLCPWLWYNIGRQAIKDISKQGTTSVSSIFNLKLNRINSLFVFKIEFRTWKTSLLTCWIMFWHPMVPRHELGTPCNPLRFIVASLGNVETHSWNPIVLLKTLLTTCWIMFLTCGSTQTSTSYSSLTLYFLLLLLLAMQINTQLIYLAEEFSGNFFYV